MSSVTHGSNDENGVHHHQNSRKTPVLARSNQCHSEAGVVDDPGHLVSSSLGSQSQDSLNEQPRNKLMGKWHRNISFGWKLLLFLFIHTFTDNFKPKTNEIQQVLKNTQKLKVSYYWKVFLFLI